MIGWRVPSTWVYVACAFDAAATIETTVVVRNLPRSGGRGKESQMHTPGPFPASALKAAVAIGALYLRALGPLRLRVSRPVLRPVREHVRQCVLARRGRPHGLGLPDVHTR